MFAGFIRYKAVLAYQGTCFEGWQSQLHGRTVQDYIERILYKLFGKKQAVIGASRTDSGVHAYGQVFTFYAPNIIEKDRLLFILNSNFSDVLFIRSLELAESTFHPQYDARKKVYQYSFTFEKQLPHRSPFVFFKRQKIDVIYFSQLLDSFKGTYDFRLFSFLTSEKTDTIRTIYDVRCALHEANIFVVTFVGSGFLRYMIRKIIGFLFLAVHKRYDVSIVKKILSHSESKPIMIPIAPPEGLVLTDIFYDLRVLQSYENPFFRKSNDF